MTPNDRPLRPAGYAPVLRVLGCILGILALAAAEPTVGWAGEAAEPRISFDLPADDAERSLKRFSQRSGLEVLFVSDAARNVRTKAVKGDYTPREALDRMLAGTRLAATQKERNGAVTIVSTANGGSRNGSAGRNETSPSEQKKKPPTMTSRNPLTLLVAAAFWTTASLSAQSTGTIEGRVQDAATGNYLNNARVAVAGSTQSALSNEFGEYRLTGVAAGEVRIAVFYSGLPTETATVTVAAGGRAVRDFELRSTPASGGVVRLGAFTVKAEQLSEAALATNEQRFAPNMKTVIDAESFGQQTDGNLADFLKFVPGLAVNYLAQDANSATVRGMPPHTTIVSFNGNEMASSPTGATRAFEFEKVTINDAAQIEFNKTLLPDMPAEGIGGTINIVTKSAFQRSRPQFTYRTYFNFNTNWLELGKTPGIERQRTYKTKPGFDFTYIRPVNRNFGFTISAAMLGKYNPQNLSITNWTLNPDAAGNENPYLGRGQLQDTPKFTDRYSGRIGLDWRFGERNVVTLGYSQQYYDASWMGRRYAINAGANPASFGPRFTQGRPAAGQMNLTGNAAHKYGTTWTPEFKYTYTGTEWRSEVRGSYSQSTAHMRAADNRHFQNMNFTMGRFDAAGVRQAPTVRIEDRGNYLPTVITSFGGVEADSQNLDEYYLVNATDLNREVTDVKKGVYAHTQRTVTLAGVPVRIRTGGDVRQKIRDLRAFDPTYTFVGPDGVPNTRDEMVPALGADLVDPYSNVSPPFGLAKFRWPSQYKLYDLYLAHPNWWTRNAAADHQLWVTNSRYLRETVSSGFVRLDASFFRGRLAFVGGVRFQSYRSRAEAGEVNNLGQYLQDESGNLVLDPVTGAPIRLTGSSLEITERTNIERGVVTHGKVKDYFPSFNLVYHLKENLQFRFGFADSVSYPNLGELAAVTTVSDVTAVPPRLTANSPLKPWYAKNYDFDIEYYTPAGGSFTLSFFRKDITDFVNQVRLNAGTPEARAALERYGYGPLFPLQYEVLERFNGGEASFDGWEFDARQNLDRFLPRWARGVTVFANASYTSAPSGVSAGNISAASQRLMNWGATYRRGKVHASLRWNHKPEPKRRQPNTTHPISYTLLDVDLSYQLRPTVNLFVSASNVTSEPMGSIYLYTDKTPDYARRQSYDVYGIQCNLGIKGQF